MSKFEENKNAKWVLLFLNATELGLERASRKKIVYIEHTDYEDQRTLSLL